MSKEPEDSLKGMKDLVNELFAENAVLIAEVRKLRIALAELYHEHLILKHEKIMKGEKK
jgi:regulator of replication initiation timing